MIKELEKTYKKDEIDVVIQRFVQAAFDMQNERLLGDRKAMHSQIYEVASIASNSFITETNYLEMKKEIDNKLQRFPAYKHIFGQIQKFLIDDVGIDNVIQLKKIDEKNLSDFIINKYKDENYIYLTSQYSKHMIQFLHFIRIQVYRMKDPRHLAPPYFYPLYELLKDDTMENNPVIYTVPIKATRDKNRSYIKTITSTASTNRIDERKTLGIKDKNEILEARRGRAEAGLGESDGENRSPTTEAGLGERRRKPKPNHRGRIRRATATTQPPRPD